MKRLDTTVIPQALQKTASDSLLFADLTDEVTTSLLETASSRQVPKGAVVFHQGDPPDHLLQIASGLVKMTQINQQGAQTTLRILGAGELIGCVAVFQQIPYPATATTIEDTTVLAWGAPYFLDMMGRHPILTENSLRIVGNRTKEMVERVVAMTGKRVEQRIAAAILQLAEQVGTKVDGGIQIEFPVTRDDLAEMAGVTYFTISRALSGWQKLGFVKNGRLRVVILAPDKLARIAAGADI